jgi:hypothetical protein
LGFTKKTKKKEKKKKHRRSPWSVLLFSSSQNYHNQSHGVHFYSFFVHHTQKRTTHTTWGRFSALLLCLQKQKASSHGISLAFSHDMINSKRLSALSTTPKLENICAMSAFEV